MKRIRKIIFFAVLTFGFARPASADLFGGDVVVLTQILTNAIKQLVEMQKIVQNGQGMLDILRDVNRGINDSLQLVNSLGPYIDPGIYHDLKKTLDIAEKLHSLYGTAIDSPNQAVENDTDTVVAETLNMNNQLYDYSKELDSLAENIKGYSQTASPGVAAKLTAQSLGVLVHVMSRQVQAQGQSMKIQAQELAVQNMKEKANTKVYLEQASVLNEAMKNKEFKFALPRF